MKPQPSPLKPILNDIEKALDAKLYYLAIAVSLSLPDICVCLACEPGKSWTNQKTYEPWCKANLQSEFQHLIAADVYRLRCGILHQGNFGRPDDRYDRILFTTPESVARVHDAFVSLPAATGSDPDPLALIYEAESFRTGGLVVRPGEKALILDVALFCRQMMGAAEQWFKKNANDPNVKANAPHLIRLRPEFPPYFDGISVVA